LDSNYIFKVFNKKHQLVLKKIGSVILGVSEDELPSDYLEELDDYVLKLDNYLRADLTKMLTLFNTRLLSMITISGWTKFTNKSLTQQEKYYNKFLNSKLPIFRTIATVLRSLVSWSYYSSEEIWDDLDLPGKTIDREEITPTLKNTHYRQLQEEFNSDY
jgi:hypothetical protein